MEERYLVFIQHASDEQVEKLVEQLEVLQDRDFEEMIMFLTSLIN